MRFWLLPIAAIVLFSLLTVGCRSRPTPSVLSTPASAAQTRAEQEALRKWKNNGFEVAVTRDETLPARPVVSLKLSTKTEVMLERNEKNEAILKPDPPFQDSLLDGLEAFPHLRTLRLSSCWINGTGLSHLKEHAQIRELNLSSSHIEDAGLKALPALPNLEKLDLGATEITDASMKEVLATPISHT